MILTEADILALSAHLGLSREEFLDRHAVLAGNRAQLSLAEDRDGACVFLSGNLCVVYEVRPEQCRTFPAGWSVSGCRAHGRNDQKSWPGDVAK